MKNESIPNQHSRFFSFQNKVDSCEEDFEFSEGFLNEIKKHCYHMILFNANSCMNHLMSITDYMMQLDNDSDVIKFNNILLSEGVIPVVKTLFQSVFDLKSFEIIAKFCVQWTRGTEFQIYELFDIEIFNQIIKMMNIEFDKYIAGQISELILSPSLSSACCNILIECKKLPDIFIHEIFNLYFHWVDIFPSKKSVFLHIIQLFSTIITYSQEIITDNEAKFLAKLFTRWVIDDDEILSYDLSGYYYFFKDDKFKKFQKEYFTKEFLENLPIFFISDTPNIRKFAMGILSLYVDFSTKIVFQHFNFSKLEYVIVDQSDDVKLCFISTIDYIIDYDDVLLYLSDEGIIHVLVSLSDVQESFEVRNSSVLLLLKKIISKSDFTILSNLIFCGLINILIPFLFIYQGENLNLLLENLNIILSFIYELETKQFNLIFSRILKEKLPEYFEELRQNYALPQKTDDLIYMIEEIYKTSLSRYEENKT